MWFRRNKHDELQAIRRVAETEDGKVLFRTLFKECGLNTLSAIDDDTHGTYLREGKRSIGLAFLTIINMTDDELAKLLIEEKPPVEDYLND
jgi:hypothetical protein